MKGIFFLGLVLPCAFGKVIFDYTKGQDALFPCVLPDEADYETATWQMGEVPLLYNMSGGVPHLNEAMQDTLEVIANENTNEVSLLIKNFKPSGDTITCGYGDVIHETFLMMDRSDNVVIVTNSSVPVVFSAVAPPDVKVATWIVYRIEATGSRKACAVFNFNLGTSTSDCGMKFVVKDDFITKTRNVSVIFNAEFRISGENHMLVELLYNTVELNAPEKQSWLLTFVDTADAYGTPGNTVGLSCHSGKSVGTDILWLTSGGAEVIGPASETIAPAPRFAGRTFAKTINGIKTLYLQNVSFADNLKYICVDMWNYDTENTASNAKVDVSEGKPTVHRLVVPRGGVSFSEGVLGDDMMLSFPFKPSHKTKKGVITCDGHSTHDGNITKGTDGRWHYTPLYPTMYPADEAWESETEDNTPGVYVCNRTDGDKAACFRAETVDGAEIDLNDLAIPPHENPLPTAFTTAGGVTTVTFLVKNVNWEDALSIWGFSALGKKASTKSPQLDSVKIVQVAGAHDKYEDMSVYDPMIIDPNAPTTEVIQIGSVIDEGTLAKQTQDLETATAATKAAAFSGWADVAFAVTDLGMIIDNAGTRSIKLLNSHRLKLAEGLETMSADVTAQVTAMIAKLNSMAASGHRVYTSQDQPGFTFTKLETMWNLFNEQGGQLTQELTTLKNELQSMIGQLKQTRFYQSQTEAEYLNTLKQTAVSRSLDIKEEIERRDALPASMGPYRPEVDWVQKLKDHIVNPNPEVTLPWVHLKQMIAANDQAEAAPAPSPAEDDYEDDDWNSDEDTEPERYDPNPVRHKGFFDESANANATDITFLTKQEVVTRCMKWGDEMAGGNATSMTEDQLGWAHDCIDQMAVVRNEFLDTALRMGLPKGDYDRAGPEASGEVFGTMFSKTAALVPKDGAPVATAGLVIGGLIAVSAMAMVIMAVIRNRRKRRARKSPIWIGGVYQGTEMTINEIEVEDPCAVPLDP